VGKVNFEWRELFRGRIEVEFRVQLSIDVYFFWRWRGMGSCRVMCWGRVDSNARDCTDRASGTRWQQTELSVSIRGN